MLMPARYDQLEREAEAKLPNRLVSAARPGLFQFINYPSHTSDPQTLWRWADVMHECRFDKDFKEFLEGGLTLEEWELWQIISKTVLAVTLEMGNPLVPRSALARATYTFRCLHALVKPPAVVVEIGPGSGYLSGMLHLAGYTVVSVENCQAFYLWQHRFWERLCPKGFLELASRATDEVWEPGKFYHMPWWRFYRQDDYLQSQSVSAITANHCLGEMSRDALGYVAMLCGVWTNKKDDPATVFVEHTGLAFSNSLDYVNEVLSKARIPLKQWINVYGDVIKDKPVKLNTIVEFQQELLGQPDLRTPDERWLQAIYGKDHYN